MLIKKKLTSLLLVALIATMPAQSAPMDTLNALLARMQNNVIARQLMTKKAAALLGVTAAGIGLLWWLKNRQTEQSRGVEAEKEEETSPIASSSSNRPATLVREKQSDSSITRAFGLLVPPGPGTSVHPASSSTSSPSSVASSSLGEVATPSEQVQPGLQGSGLSVPLAAQIAPFFVQTKMSSWQELPGILQDAQKNHGLDLSKTAVALDYDGTLVHDVYPLRNRKKLNLVLYEYYGVKPELFNTMHREYRNKEKIGSQNLFADFILNRYSEDERHEFEDAYWKHEFPSVYMEDQSLMELVIGNLVTQAAFVGVCSRSRYTSERGKNIAQLGVKGDEGHWCEAGCSKYYSLNLCIREKKKDDALLQEVNTYVLIDNDKRNIDAFVELAKKEKKVNVLGIYYTRVDDMVTQDALRKEIDDLLSKSDSGAGVNPL